LKPAANTATATPLTAFEMIDCTELGKRWSLPASWVKEQTRSRAADPLPCVRFGKYVRFAWGSSRASRVANPTIFELVCFPLT
jgi:hypothetical protein